jgi:hypothetical protein
VDLAFSQIGSKYFAGFHFRVLRQFFEAFAFLLRVGIHSLSKVCDMSHEMAISIMNVSKG